jgi:hypothetical protein
MVRVAGVEPAWTCSQGMWVAATLHPESWWLVTELNRVHRLFRPALCRRVPEPNLVDGTRLELAFHGCRPWVIPLYEPPIWGEMRESNSRDWSHNPVPKPFGQSRHKTSGAGRVNRTLVGEVQALCTPTVLDQQNFGAGTQPRTAVGRLPCACSSR